VHLGPSLNSNSKTKPLVANFSRGRDAAHGFQRREAMPSSGSGGEASAGPHATNGGRGLPRGGLQRANHACRRTTVWQRRRQHTLAAEGGREAVR
jgi:hypothetical protein